MYTAARRSTLMKMSKNGAKTLDFFPDVLYNSLAFAKASIYAPLAQLDRALVYGTKGWGFELLRARQKRLIRIVCEQFGFAFYLDNIAAKSNDKKPPTACMVLSAVMYFGFSGAILYCVSLGRQVDFSTRGRTPSAIKRPSCLHTSASGVLRSERNQAA